MEQELDYLREATMCDRLRTAIGHDDPADDVIRVPEVFHELSHRPAAGDGGGPRSAHRRPGGRGGHGAPPHSWPGRC